MDHQAARLAMVRSNWGRVAGTLALASLVNLVQDVDGKLQQVDRALDDVRARGYRFGRDWEPQMEELYQRWTRQHDQAMRLIDDERHMLQNAAYDVEQLLSQASHNGRLIGTVESRIHTLQNNVRQAEMRVRDIFDTTREQVDALQEEVRQAHDVLEAVDSASFNLYPDEHAVAAGEAVWVDDPAEPEGVLFLTDRRVIFEQRQEITTKKVLFIATEKELIQEKLWESPVGAVEELEAEDERAFLRRRELLTLRFSERTRDTPSDVTLQLRRSDNETWRGLIRRVKSGQIEAERFGAPEPEQQLADQIEAESEDAERALPTVCPNCGAPLPPIFKGMQQVLCDYCGSTINI
jgi:uncharacterized protein YukE